MDKQIVTITKDRDNGITLIPLKKEEVVKSKSLSDEGSKFLDSIGGDVVLHFDKNDKLVEIELIGFDV